MIRWIPLSVMAGVALMSSSRTPKGSGGGVKNTARRVEALEADARRHHLDFEARRLQLHERLRTFLRRPRTLVGLFAAGMLVTRVRAPALSRASKLLSTALLGLESFTAATRLVNATSRHVKKQPATGSKVAAVDEVANGK